MDNKMFKIIGAGIFDSRERFHGLVRSKKRKVKIYELEFFIENGKNTYINDIAYPMKAGNVLFARPGDERFSELHFKCFFLHFYFLDEKLEEIARQLGPVIEIDNVGEMREKFEKIINASVSSKYIDAISAEAELVLFIQELLRAEHNLEGVANKARHFIKQNIAENIDVCDIASFCNISESYLHKLFSEKYGQSPIEYLVDKRIEKAKKMLLNTNMSLSEIALNCGYNSQSYFSYAFKKKTEMTPTAFRKKSKLYIG